MALVKEKHNKRIEHPSEPGTWAVIAVPFTVGDVEGSQATDRVGASIDLVTAVLVEWSYDEPVSRDSVRKLDIATFRWLEAEIDQANQGRPEEEKKDSASVSSATSAQDEAISQPSLATS